MGARIFHSTFSSPSLGEVDGRTLVFYGGADGVVYCFEALRKAPPPGEVSTLRLVWQFDCDPNAPRERIEQYQGNREISPSSIIAPPVLHQGRLYVVAGGDPWHGKRQAWIQCIDPSGTGDITSTGSALSQTAAAHVGTRSRIPQFLWWFQRHPRFIQSALGSRPEETEMCGR